MTSFVRHAVSVAALAASAAVVLGAAAPAAHAQFGPPQSLYGSINAESGEIPEGTKVEAYIGDTECSDGGGITAFTGIGDARVAVYGVNVVGADFREGCGTPGAVVRVKIGDEFGEQTTTWDPGLRGMDVTIGDVEPLVIPTYTPRPATAVPNTPTGPEATGTAQSAGSSQPSQGARTNTPQGGLTSSTPGASSAGGGDGDGDGGFPVWGIVVIGLAVIGAAGGGIGYLVSRNNREPGIEDF